MQRPEFDVLLSARKELLSLSLTEAVMCQCRGRKGNPVQGTAAETLLLLAALVLLPAEGDNATARVVRLAVIAPADLEHEQSLYRVLPAVQLAVRRVADPVTGSLPGWDILVEHRDSQCSSTFGPLAAFEFYINRSAGTEGGQARRKQSR